MKQQRSNPCLFFLIGFCGLVLFSPFALMRAEEAPAPSGTPAQKEHPSVRAVGVHKWDEEQRAADVIYAQRGDEIWVDIINFKEWVNSLVDKKPLNHEVRDLILYLDHFPLLGISPIYSCEKTAVISAISGGSPRRAAVPSQLSHLTNLKILGNCLWKQ